MLQHFSCKIAQHTLHVATLLLQDCTAVIFWTVHESQQTDSHTISLYHCESLMQLETLISDQRVLFITSGGLLQ
jgi:hypothetical protein